MNLTQSEKNEILSHIGGHPDNEPCEPLAQDNGPRFPYAAIRDRITGYAPPVPTCYGTREDERAEDDEEDTEDEMLEETLRSFVRDKQGRESSGDVLPSMRTRGAIRSELASMGCIWGE